MDKKYWVYKVIIYTDYPQDLENNIKSIDNIKFFRADPFDSSKEALENAIQKLDIDKTINLLKDLIEKLELNKNVSYKK